MMTDKKTMAPVDDWKAPLWRQNPALIQLLGLSPLLAVSESTVTALGMGLATLLVITLSSAIMPFLLRTLTPLIRLPVMIIVIAGLATVADLIVQAQAYGFYKTVGIFIPLLASQSVVLALAQQSTEQSSYWRSLRHGFVTGLGFVLALVLLGTIRELLNTGSILANMQMLFANADDWTIHLLETEQRFKFVLMPPGAFICLGLIIAAMNRFKKR